MDDYYCLVKLTVSHYLVVSIFNNNYASYPICLFANSSHLLYQLIVAHDVHQNISIGHCLYLARELYKAELAMQLDQLYIQK